MTGHAIIDTLIYLVVCGLIFWLIWWFVNWVGVPEPFRKVIQVLLGLCALVVLIDVLLGFAGHGFIHFRQ